MATVSTSPPPPSQSPNIHRSREIYESMSSERTLAESSQRNPLTLSSMPMASNARIRNPPASPVRVNVQQADWVQPSNVDIEHAQSQSAQADSISRSHFNEYMSISDVPPRLVLDDGPESDQYAARSPTGNSQGYRPQDALSSPSASTIRHGDYATPREESFPPFESRPERAEPGVMSPADRVRQQDAFRNSRESDETASSSREPPSVESSVATSASSISGTLENADCPPNVDSAGSSVIEGSQPRNDLVPQFQYHHHHEQPQRAPSAPLEAMRNTSQADQFDQAGNNIRRHLTPNSSHFRQGSLTRPQSSYSTLSDFGPRGRSPGLLPSPGSNLRAPSQSRRSPDVRQSTYAELLNVPYPQQAPPPMTVDNSNLRGVVGNNASLLSTHKTLEMYRQNVKKTNDFSIQYSFAVFLISSAQEQGLDITDPKGLVKKESQPLRDHDSPIIEANVKSPYELVREARQILQRLASGGYPFAQYYLADGYASGLFSKGKEDYNSAFPLFVLAAKHGHAESAYRTALCYEFGWGCRKDPAKAVQFLRTAASKRHPGAMTRLGKACLSGDLGEKRYREGVKWMKLASESADSQYNSAPYQLGCLYETGYGDDVFLDVSYAAELFTQAADLGHPEANYRMGDAYEHGRLNCPRDPALSVHFYTGAAERGHAAAMMGLCAWYMVGAPPILEKDEEEAYEWASRSAELGFVKAQYAVGYFTEMGIGSRRDPLEANVWYVKAADSGDERAKQRLAIIQAAVSGGGVPMDVAPPRNGKITKGGKDDKECVVM